MALGFTSVIYKTASCESTPPSYSLVTAPFTLKPSCLLFTTICMIVGRQASPSPTAIHCLLCLPSAQWNVTSPTHKSFTFLKYFSSSDRPLFTDSPRVTQHQTHSPHFFQHVSFKQHPQATGRPGSCGLRGSSNEGNSPRESGRCSRPAGRYCVEIQPYQPRWRDEKHPPRTPPAFRPGRFCGRCLAQ